MPLTRFRSLALLNGLAAMIRAAITCPIPGTAVSSFSVAVLMSISPSGFFAFARDPLFGTRFQSVNDLAGFADCGTDDSADAKRDPILPPATKELKTGGVCGRTFNRPELIPQAPI